MRTGDGLIWLGLNNAGLISFDPLTGKRNDYWHDPSDPTSLSINNVISLHDGGENIWVGTWGGGLNRFERSIERFERFTTADGLPNNVVYGILEDTNGDLWMSTNQGLSRFDPKSRTFRIFDVRDGLQGEEFNAHSFHRGYSGQMYFGGVLGITSFRPESVRDDLIAPDMVISGVEIRDRHGEVITRSGGYLRGLAEPLRLSHHDLSLSVRYAALHYNDPIRNRYAYRLTGLEEEWREVGDVRLATIWDLDPGRYCFEIKGSNSDGTWSEEVASLELMVIPSWWGTLWFRILLGLAMVSLPFGLYRFRTMTMKRRNRELDETNLQLMREVAERMLAEEKSNRVSAQLRRMSVHMQDVREEERAAIAREIHDELGQALTAMKVDLQWMGQQLPQHHPPMREKVNGIEELVDILLGTTHRLTAELRPPPLDDLGLAAALQWEAEEWSKPTGVTCELILGLDGTELDSEQSIAVYRIFQEVLTNVARHARATRVMAHIRAGHDQLEMEMTDNGVGISQHQIDDPESYGLLGIRERVLQFSGQTTIEGFEGKGTRIRVSLPLNGHLTYDLDDGLWAD
jgi:signal transduction histidine kinase